MEAVSQTQLKGVKPLAHNAAACCCCRQLLVNGLITHSDVTIANQSQSLHGVYDFDIVTPSCTLLVQHCRPTSRSCPAGIIVSRLLLYRPTEDWLTSQHKRKWPPSVLWWMSTMRFLLLDSTRERGSRVLSVSCIIYISSMASKVFLPRDATPNAVMLSAPLIRFRPWRYTNLLTYLLTYLCRLSVCLTECPSVTFRYCDHIGWNTSKIISRLISLRFMCAKRAISLKRTITD